MPPTPPPANWSGRIEGDSDATRVEKGPRVPCHRPPCLGTAMRRRFYPWATFRGLRHVPIVAISRNSLYPALEIDQTRLIITVIRRHSLVLADLEAVDVAWRLARQVTFIPRKGLWTFSANFSGEAEGLAVVKALGEWGVPLTPQASRCLQANAAGAGEAPSP